MAVASEARTAGSADGCSEPVGSTITSSLAWTAVGGRARCGAGSSARMGGGDRLPGLILDPLGAVVKVDLLKFLDLPSHSARLDAFEGEGYRRVATRVSTPEGEVSA